MKQSKTILLILTVSVITGCETVKITERVVYQDQSPVIETEVHQFNDTADYTTYTDYAGKWSLNLPIDSEWELEIRNPRNNYEWATYMGKLTVDSKGTLK